jgi:hypothetical protein
MSLKPRFASECYRYGEPNDHQLACQYLSNFFKGIFEDKNAHFPKYAVLRNWKQYFPSPFIAKHKLDYDKHSFDVAIFGYLPAFLVGSKPKAIFEVGQVCDCTVTLPDGNNIKVKKSRHSKKKQMINDGVIKDYCETYFPNVPLYRPEKSDCLSYKYLYDEYRSYLN